MSTAEGYELHVYCDEPGCRGEGQFADYTRKKCYRQARDAGWIASMVVRAPEKSIAGGNRAVCPKRSGKTRKPEVLKPGERYVSVEEMSARARRIDP